MVTWAAIRHGVPESNIKYVRERGSAGKPVPYRYLVTVERYYAHVPRCDDGVPRADNRLSRRANPDYMEGARCRSIRNLAQSVSDPADFKGSDVAIQIEPVLPERAPDRKIEAAPADELTGEPTDNDAISGGAGSTQNQPIN